METGVTGRVKPFAVEVRNVKCVRCGNFGHQSGDRECPLKDAIMPNEESRLKRDDPLTAIMAHMDPSEVSHGVNVRSLFSLNVFWELLVVFSMDFYFAM